MKVRTTEASGRVLDYLVAKCKAKDRWYYNEFDKCVYIGCDDAAYHPSTNRDQGYEILERERITIRHWDNEPFVTAYMPTFGSLWVHGKDPLEAGLRAYVHSKLGEEVDIPIQLTQLGE